MAHVDLVFGTNVENYSQEAAQKALTQLRTNLLAADGTTRSGVLTLNTSGGTPSLETAQWWQSRATAQNATNFVRQLIEKAYGRETVDAVGSGIEAYLSASASKFGSKSFVKLIDALEGRTQQEFGGRLILGKKLEQPTRQTPSPVTVVTDPKPAVVEPEFNLEVPRDLIDNIAKGLVDTQYRYGGAGGEKLLQDTLGQWEKCQQWITELKPRLDREPTSQPNAPNGNPRISSLIAGLRIAQDEIAKRLNNDVRAQLKAIKDGLESPGSNAASISSHWRHLTMLQTHLAAHGAVFDNDTKTALQNCLKARDDSFTAFDTETRGVLAPTPATSDVVRKLCGLACELAEASKLAPDDQGLDKLKQDAQARANSALQEYATAIGTALDTTATSTTATSTVPDPTEALRILAKSLARLEKAELAATSGSLTMKATVDQLKGRDALRVFHIVFKEQAFTQPTQQQAQALNKLYAGGFLQNQAFLEKLHKVASQTLAGRTNASDAAWSWVTDVASGKADAINAVFNSAEWDPISLKLKLTATPDKNEAAKIALDHQVFVAKRVLDHLLRDDNPAWRTPSLESLKAEDASGLASQGMQSLRFDKTTVSALREAMRNFPESLKVDGFNLMLARVVILDARAQGNWKKDKEALCGLLNGLGIPGTAEAIEREIEQGFTNTADIQRLTQGLQDFAAKVAKHSKNLSDLLKKNKGDQAKATDIYNRLLLRQAGFVTTHELADPTVQQMMKSPLAAISRTKTDALNDQLTRLAALAPHLTPPESHASLARTLEAANRLKSDSQLQTGIRQLRGKGIFGHYFGVSSKNATDQGISKGLEKPTKNLTDLFAIRRGDTYFSEIKKLAETIGAVDCRIGDIGMNLKSLKALKGPGFSQDSRFTQLVKDLETAWNALERAKQKEPLDLTSVAEAERKIRYCARRVAGLVALASEETEIEIKAYQEAHVSAEAREAARSIVKAIAGDKDLRDFDATCKLVLLNAFRASGVTLDEFRKQVLSPKSEVAKQIDDTLSKFGLVHSRSKDGPNDFLTYVKALLVQTENTDQLLDDYGKDLPELYTLVQDTKFNRLTASLGLVKAERFVTNEALQEKRQGENAEHITQEIRSLEPDQAFEIGFGTKVAVTVEVPAPASGLDMTAHFDAASQNSLYVVREGNNYVAVCKGGKSGGVGVGISALLGAVSARVDVGAKVASGCRVTFTDSGACQAFVNRLFAPSTQAGLNIGQMLGDAPVALLDERGVSLAVSAQATASVGTKDSETGDLTTGFSALIEGQVQGEIAQEKVQDGEGTTVTVKATLSTTAKAAVDARVDGISVGKAVRATTAVATEAQKHTHLSSDAVGTTAEAVGKAAEDESLARADLAFKATEEIGVHTTLDDVVTTQTCIRKTRSLDASISDTTGKKASTDGDRFKQMVKDLTANSPLAKSREFADLTDYYSKIAKPGSEIEIQWNLKWDAVQRIAWAKRHGGDVLAILKDRSNNYEATSVKITLPGDPSTNEGMRWHSQLTSRLPVVQATVTDATSKQKSSVYTVDIRELSAELAE